MLFDSKLDQLIEGTAANRRSVQCKSVEFPNHTQSRFKTPCNTVLMNRVRRKGNKIDYKARKVYCYYGVKAALKGARTSSGAWAGSVAKGFVSETKAATELEQRPTERPMPLQHAAANSRLQL